MVAVRSLRFSCVQRRVARTFFMEVWKWGCFLKK
nr:MAG TPA: hypothetical protein [Bacteriophage sp.]